jgi:hypothetical protein
MILSVLIVAAAAAWLVAAGPTVEQQRKLNNMHPAAKEANLGERLSQLDTDGTYLGSGQLTADELAAITGAAAPSAANVFATAADVVAGGALASGKIILGDALGAPQPVTPTGDVTITNAGVTAIAADSIINADVKTTAAIAWSKLAALATGQLVVGNGGVPTATTLSGDVTVNASGVAAIGDAKVTAAMLAGAVPYSKLTLTGALLNADVNASAAIAWSKMAPLADGKILLGNGTNVATAVTPSGHVSMTNAGVVSLDLHAVTAATAVPDVADLVAIADESAGGDPTLAFTVAELLTAAGDVTALSAAPAVDDRLLVTDESTAGDPARSITVQELLDAANALGDITPVITTAGTDKILVVDATDNTAKTGTLLEILTAAAGDGLDQDATSGALALGVHNLGTTVAAPVITAAGSDFLAVSDESEAGDPTGKASLFSVLTAAAGDGLAQDGTTGALGITAATADRVPYPTASSVDNTNGTATVTIQVKNAIAANLAASVLVRFWTGTANDYGVDALTGLTVASGTQQRAVEANAELMIVTTAAGVATVTVTQAAGTYYAWVEVGGLIAPVTITITGP